MHSKFEDFTDEATIFFERSYDINGYSYLVLFGHHVNGGIENDRVFLRQYAEQANEDLLTWYADEIIEECNRLIAQGY